jgi:TusA-related sulfurtransferase
MNKDTSPKNPKAADFFLDISPETCPMTFVRAKLLIEKMAPGDVAEIRLQGAEPLENVPRSVLDMGHQVISLEPEAGTTTEYGIHLLVVQKS